MTGPEQTREELSLLAGLSESALERLIRRATPPADKQSSVAQRLMAKLLADATVSTCNNLSQITPIAGVPRTTPADRLDELLKSLDPPQMADELARLGDFRILEVIGAGGMGVVFRAEDSRLRREVAIKVIHPKRIRDRHAAERFLVECQAAARLTHDHVVTIHHAGQHGDIAYLVMQLLKGQPLSHRMRPDVSPAAPLVAKRRKPPGDRIFVPSVESTGDGVARDANGTGHVADEPDPPMADRPSATGLRPVPASEALSITRQVALALDAAHQLGMTHRDIKPDNIWLEESTGRVKLLDFGLAHFADENLAQLEKGFLAGTPSYIAPERIDGVANDPRSDLFSLGVVLYEMLTGRRPFDAGDVTATLQAIRRKPLPALGKLEGLESSQTDQLVRRLLERMPESRIQSARELVAEMDSVLASAANRNSPEHARAARQQKTRVARRATALVMVCGFAVLSVFLLSGRWASESRRQRESEARQRYAPRIREAQAEWEAGNLNRMADLLDQVRPQPDLPDLRGWEWHHLDAFRPDPSRVVDAVANGYSAACIHRDWQATAENGSATVRVRNLATGLTVTEFDVGGADVSALALSHDGKRLACSLERGEVEVWDIANASRIASVDVPAACLALNTNGAWLVCGTNETLVVVDVDRSIVAQRIEQRYLQANTGQIEFSPDGRFCGVGIKYVATLQVFDAATWERQAGYLPHGGQSNAMYCGIAWHPDSEHVAVAHGEKLASGGKISVWNVVDKRIVHEFPALQSHLIEEWAVLDYAPDGEHLLIGEQGGTIAVVHPATAERTCTIPAAAGEYHGIAFSSSGDYIHGVTKSGTTLRSVWKDRIPVISFEATGRADWTNDSKVIVSKLNIEGIEHPVRIRGNSIDSALESIAMPTGNWVPAIACSPVDDRIAISAQCGPETKPPGNDRFVYIVEPEALKPLVAIPAEYIKALAWSPDGKFLAGGQVFTAHAVHVWDAMTGRLVWSNDDSHRDDVESVAWSSDGKWIATRDVQGRVVLWEPATGKQLACLEQDPSHPVCVDGQWGLSFSPDSQQLAVAFGPHVRLWDLGSKDCVLAIAAHPGMTYAVDWSPDGRRLVSGGDDDRAKIWDAETGELLLSLAEQNDVALACFSPDGLHLLTHAASHGPLRLRSAGTRENGFWQTGGDTRSMAAARSPDSAPSMAHVPFTVSRAQDLQEKWARHLEHDAVFENSLAMEFRLLPPGKFMMGAPGSPAESPASPPHEVTLSRPFYMATFETTRAQFAQFCEATGWQTQGETEGIALALDREADSVLSLTDRRFSWRAPGFEQQDDHPVVGVNRKDAMAFCEWLASTDERKYRLPTEAEWEYACRAGTAEDIYWSMPTTEFSVCANFMDASLAKAGIAARQTGEPESDGHCFTAPVGTFPPNPFGLHDMAGNVGEWCSDRFGAYADSPQTDPAGPETGDYGLFRGGHWLAPRNQCYSWYRAGPFVPQAARATFGFRVVCECED